MVEADGFDTVTTFVHLTLGDVCCTGDVITTARFVWAGAWNAAAALIFSESTLVVCIVYYIYYYSVRSHFNMYILLHGPSVCVFMYGQATESC